MPILTGIFLGLTTLLFIGPVFFYLLKSSIESGFRAGLAVAIGIILGDIICVLLAIYGFGSFFESPENQKWFAGIGGVILLLFGLKYFFKPSLSEMKSKSNSSKNLVIYGVNGFLINFVNPFVFAVWFGFYTLNRSKFEDKNTVVSSLIVTLSVIFITDILKAYFAQKLTPFLNKKRLLMLFKVFGVIMIGFSIRLIFTFFKL
jgi:threonine/homoserine/homoserine lactone efflux protein